jgi:regulator of nucleoside diphosphate kinase
MTEEDYRALKRYAGAASKDSALTLANELERADIVRKAAFPANAIRLYTQVSLVEQRTKKRINFAIVLPEEADIRQQKISALAPVAVAVIGFRQGEEVSCKLPGGTRHFRIDEVINNPVEQ